MLKIIQIFKKVNKIIQTVTSIILLYIMYLIGVGLTAVLAKIIRKQFLNMSPRVSSWQKHSQSESLETMY